MPEVKRWSRNIIETRWVDDNGNVQKKMVDTMEGYPRGACVRLGAFNGSGK